MHGGEVGGFAAFADDEKFGGWGVFSDGVDEGAVTLFDVDVGESGGAEMAVGFGEDGVATEPGDTGFGFVEGDEFGQKGLLGVDHEAAAEVGERGAFAVGIEGVEDMDAGLGALGDPGSVIVDAGGVVGAVGAGENGHGERIKDKG